MSLARKFLQKTCFVSLPSEVSELTKAALMSSEQILDMQHALGYRKLLGFGIWYTENELLNSRCAY